MATKDINDAAKPLRDAWETIKNEYSKRVPGKRLVLTCVYRSPAEQLELFGKGRTLGSDGKWSIQDKSKVVTNVDGRTVLGAHNYKPARAIDVAVVDTTTGKYIWTESSYYPLLAIAAGVGLESGGAWKSITDWPHLQIPKYKTYEGA